MEHLNHFVEALYGHLMSHTKIFQQPLEEQLLFKEQVKEAVAVINTDELDKMLFTANWRSSLVASWLLFLKDTSQYVPSIGEILLDGKGGTIGYCFALAKFGTKSCSEYLRLYLEKELQFDKFPQERFQDTAIYALVFLDRKNDTDFAHSFLEPDGFWSKFISHEFLPNTQLMHFGRWGDFDANYSDFVRMFEFMNAIMEP